MKIAIAGLGYVGLSTAILFSKIADVSAFDVDKNKISLLKERRNPFPNTEFDDYFRDNELSFVPTEDPQAAYQNADFIIFCLPTNFNPKLSSLDTTCLEAALSLALSINQSACFVIKSTVPVGFTKKAIKELNYEKFLFVPEFLRESKSLTDCLSPQRNIIGFCKNKNDKQNIWLANKFANLLFRSTNGNNTPTILMTFEEAESVKLFSNAYLAMRVAFFNEIDNFAYFNNLDSEKIITGVCGDLRIGSFYNNPSFGYGGYCLPKDILQLNKCFNDIPHEIINAVPKSNLSRKKIIADEILKKINIKRNDVVGIYRLTAKSGGDNFRYPSVQDIIETIVLRGVKTIIYEPLCKSEDYFRVPVVKNINYFKSTSNIILANRYDPCLDDVAYKVFTRDIFGRD